MIKVQSHVMLVLSNVTMELSNVRKIIIIQPNVTKEQSYIMLVLPNVTMEPSNVRKKKKKRTTECDKSIVTCDVGIA